MTNVGDVICFMVEECALARSINTEFKIVIMVIS